MIYVSPPSALDPSPKKGDEYIPLTQRVGVHDEQSNAGVAGACKL